MPLGSLRSWVVKAGIQPFSFLWGVLGSVISLLLWWGISLLLGQQRLPTPLDVLEECLALFTHSPLLMSRGGPDQIFPHIFDSVLKYFIGVTIGVVLGISLGLIMKLRPAIYDYLILPIEGIRTIPALALSPFLLLWFGPTALSATLLIVIYVSLMLVINTISAIENVPPVYGQFAVTLGASQHKVFTTVIAFAIIPELIGAIRVALARSWGLLVVAELLGSPRGLGDALMIVTPFFAIAMIMAILLVITILANVTDLLFLACTASVSRWAARSQM